MNLTEEKFLADVAAHQMIVIRDDGLYRHIRFKRPSTGCMHFDLVTWPGCLAYSGDMGCYVFCRIEDMFEFFRMGKDDWNYNRNGGLSINPGYWSEKLMAVDGGRSKGSATEFSEEKFRRVIHSERLEWIRENRHTLTKEERRELWEAIDDEVLSRVDSEHEAMQAAYGFSHRVSDQRFGFTDLWDHDFTAFTYRFKWCCYALAWGIQKYDEVKAVEA